MDTDWISYWAERKPHDLAVALPSGVLRYSEFDGQINKVAARLEALGLPPSSRVAVAVTNEHFQWLLLLALGRLGIASTSPATPDPSSPLLANLKPNLILTSATNPVAHPNVVRISQDWIDEALRLPSAGASRHAGAPSDVVRFFSSSGTTGAPKVMALTRAQVIARIDAERSSIGFGAASRSCTMIGLGTGGGYTWPLATWSAGGSVVLNLRFTAEPYESLRRARLSHLFVAVGTLLDLVRSPAAASGALPPIEVYVAGSALPLGLATEAEKIMGSNIRVKYAASEVSGVATGTLALLRQHGGTPGYIQPSAEVEAVDDSGRVLPPGTIGILRVRTAGMITGYLNERPNARDSAVRDGWFYPGDLGSVSTDRLLLVQGRAGDVMNVGGDKLDPQRIEELALSCAGIRDAAAFTVPDRYGVEVPWIAVVRGDNFRQGEVLDRLTRRFPQLRGLHVAIRAEIPRNHMGKIERLRLREEGIAWTATPS
jgi:acyl-CoA synthetase (AMP-forming)/AMP-acid ligase II